MKMPRKSPKRLIAVARHEAAHAVIGELLGFRVFELSIGGELGNCGLKIGPKKADPLQLAMVVMAGHAADVLFNGRRKTRIAKEDHAVLVKMGFKGRSFPTLLALAMGIVSENELTIRTVANFLKKKDLTGREVRKIMHEY
jgi:hypothetical protein